MGYRGKVREREEARRLRAAGLTMPEIAGRLGVSRSSVSLWTRDVPFATAPSRRPVRREPNRLQRAKAAQVQEAQEEGRRIIASLSDRDLLIAGTALYAGEGAKTDGCVRLANSDTRMVALHCRWLRRFFDIDESRLRVQLYLHAGLDLEAAVDHWTATTGIPASQFTRPYRAVPDAGIRHSKHVYGCPGVSYACSRTHRRIMGLVDALLA